MNKQNQMIGLQNGHATLINLYHRSRQQKTNVGAVGNAKIRSTRHVELSIFKQQLKKTFSRSYSYVYYARRVKSYRMIFFTLALLFVALGMILFLQNISLTGLILGGLKPLIKGGICTLAFILSIAAIATGYSLCIAKEATTALATKIRRQIAQTYQRKRIECRLKGYLPQLREPEKHAVLKSTYQAMLDIVDEHQEETNELLREVMLTKHYKSGSQELLFGQALIHMEEQLQHELHKFQRFSL